MKKIFYLACSEKSEMRKPASLLGGMIFLYGCAQRPFPSCTAYLSLPIR